MKYDLTFYCICRTTTQWETKRPAYWHRYPLC
jgi:hypothetical protein